MEPKPEVGAPNPPEVAVEPNPPEVEVEPKPPEVVVDEGQVELLPKPEVPKPEEVLLYAHIHMQDSSTSKDCQLF